MHKKIFAIYDLNTMPYSIGDIITFISAIQVIKCRNHIEKYDICFIANCRDNPDNIFSKLVNAENQLHYYRKLVDVLQINDTLGSIYYCKDYYDFYELYAMKKSDNIIWPELSAIQAREYLHYRIYLELHNYKEEFGHVPTVFKSDILTKWAYAFYAKHIDGFMPVTINIRNNKLFSFHRNSNINSWLEFISYCKNKYPVKFVLICAKSEIDERLFAHDNVIITKQMDTSISQEISLIVNSLLHIGSASGPATISPFVSHPSLLLNADVLPYIDQYKGALLLYRDSNHARLSFSKEYQYYSTFPETVDYLINEFSVLWSAVDIEAWRKASNYWQNHERDATLSWLD